MWNAWKKAFDAWEDASARYLETVLKNRLLLTPAGAALAQLTKTKALVDKTLSASLGALGLATKRDQERTLHLLNRLESRLLDLEERLDERTDKKP